jgi:hypothetical protein
LYADFTLLSLRVTRFSQHLSCRTSAFVANN